MAKTIRVMVAEDFPLLREDFCDVVSAQSDMEVVGSAASGEEIASLADTVPCDVILMDIEMETIDAGIRAAEVITARHPEVKILFLTAHETDDMITSAMGTGAVDYVVKGCWSTSAGPARGGRSWTQRSRTPSCRSTPVCAAASAP